MVRVGTTGRAKNRAKCGWRQPGGRRNSRATKKPVPDQRGKNTGVQQGGRKRSRSEPATQIAGSVQPGGKQRASKKATKETKLETETGTEQKKTSACKA